MKIKGSLAALTLLLASCFSAPVTVTVTTPSSATPLPASVDDQVLDKPDIEDVMMDPSAKFRELHTAITLYIRHPVPTFVQVYPKSCLYGL